MSLVRVLRTAQVTLSHVFRVDEVPTDAAGAVAVVLKRLDGTEVDSDTATHAGVGTGTYTYAVPGQADLDSLTLDWSGSVAGADVAVRDYVEVVGGYLFDLAEARAEPPPLDAVRYPAATLARKRIEVETEFERICGQAWVPRFTRELYWGRDTNRLAVRWPMIRAVRAVSVGGTAMDVDDVAALEYHDHGVITRPGGALWPAGARIVVEYEHGWDLPPEDISAAGRLRLRSILPRTSSGIPDRAVSFTAPDGGTYRLSTPGRQRTGHPEVDGILSRPGYMRPPRAVFA